MLLHNRNVLFRLLSQVRTKKKEGKKGLLFSFGKTHPLLLSLSPPSLFDSITAWTVFAALQGLHTLFEILFYPVRMSRPVFNLYHTFNMWLQQRLEGIYSWRYRACTYEEAHQQYIDYISVEYGGRLLGFAISVVGFMIASTWVEFGYNRSMFPNLVNPNSNFNDVVTYLNLALACEAITHIILTIIMRRKFSRLLLQPWFDFIDKRHHRIILIWATAHISTDVFLAKLTTKLSSK